MKPNETPEVKLYIRTLENESDCALLLFREKVELSEVSTDPWALDWVDFNGSAVLQGYWLDANTVERQAQLGRLCHLRSVAWKAVIENLSESGAQIRPSAEYYM